MMHSAGGVVVREGKVAIVKQGPRWPSWSLPKGRIEEGETPRETAEREIREETGIWQLEFVRELGTYERYRGGTKSSGEKKRITIFLFRTRQEALRPADPANPEAKWVPLDRVADELTHEEDRKFFNNAMRLAREAVRQ